MFNFRFITFCFISFALMHSFIASAQFSTKEQNDIRKKAIKTITDYQEKTNQLGIDVRSIDKTRINIENFIKLFASRKTQVYNDLDPEHKLSEFYDVETYASDMALWYPGGINVNFDLENAQVSNIISQGEDVYSIDFIVDKQITGIYLGNKLNNNKEKLLFRIGFMVTNGQFLNFRIVGVRNAAVKVVTQDQNKGLEIKSAQLTADEEHEIDRETRTLLNDYANYLSLIGDTVEDIEEKIMYKESFRSLFSNYQSPIYNDILPDNKKNPYIPVSDYINLYSEAYATSGGNVAFKMDSADMGFIVRDREKDYKFTRIVQVNKSFKGNYLGKRKISFQMRLAIKVTFEYANLVFKNFRIVRIDIITPKKPEVTDTRTFTDLQKHKTLTKKPEQVTAKNAKELQPTSERDKDNVMLTAGIISGSGIISNSTISNLKIFDASNVWQTHNQFFYEAYFHYTYLISQNFGWWTGIGYSSVSTDFILNSANAGSLGFNNTQPEKDANNEQFIRYISANYENSISLKFIDIPVGLTLGFDLSKNLRLEITPGINIGVISSATSETKDGLIRNYGHYPSHTIPIFQNLDWPELGQGFYNDIIKNQIKDIKSDIKSPAISFNSSAGFDLNLSRHILLGLKGFWQIELTDLAKNQAFYDNLLTSRRYNLWPAFNVSTTKINLFGMAFEFIVKF